MNRRLVAGRKVLALFGAGALLADPALTQEGTSAPRAPEGTRIITLPSAKPPLKGTLQVLFTHRFVQPVGDSDYRTLFSFDSGADIGIGISYSPIENLEVSLDRSSNQDDYELAAKYLLLRSTQSRPFFLSFRVGGNARMERGIEDRTAFFAQGIDAVALGSRVRITAIPTYVSNTPLFQDVFNLPIALSVGVTRTVNIQAELVPRNRDFGASRVGWLVAIEKSVLRHRFAWTAGNLRATTVDQYAASDSEEDCLLTTSISGSTWCGSGNSSEPSSRRLIRSDLERQAVVTWRAPRGRRRAAVPSAA